ncbi:MAG TPA: SGNH/GDSL hydrolase family protein [Acidobacteriaceae bacterium]|jgi:lysophospholipase L1-like esterase|nr:SGNH/GDSL hydrolase family protein [Acidobacteriaceae bacterium]
MKKLAVVTAVVLGMTVGAWAQSAGTPMEGTAQDGYASARSLEMYREGNARMFMNDYGQLARYHDDDAKLAAPVKGEQRVVFFGDSITDSWKLDESFPGKHYINRGIGGQTTPQMLVRFRADVIDLQPAVLVVLAGTNDIAGNTGDETLEQIEGDYATMAELAKAHGIRIVFSSVMPINNYNPRALLFFLQRSPEKILALNVWLKKYCAEQGLVYLDYFSAMVDGRGMLKAELTQDGLHPNAAGFAVMAPLAEAAIAKAAAQPRVR